MEGFILGIRPRGALPSEWYFCRYSACKVKRRCFSRSDLNLRKLSSRLLGTRLTRLTSCTGSAPELRRDRFTAFLFVEVSPEPDFLGSAAFTGLLLFEALAGASLRVLRLLSFLQSFAAFLRLFFDRRESSDKVAAWPSKV